jgi:hypothetical protein
MFSLIRVFWGIKGRAAWAFLPAEKEESTKRAVYNWGHEYQPTQKVEHHQK